LWRCSDFDCPTFINIDDEDDVPAAPRPGESAQATYERERAERTERLLRGFPFLAAVAILVAFAAFFAVLGITQNLGFGGASAALVIAAFMWYVMRQPDEILYWGKGAEAERRIGAKLDALEQLGFVTLYDRRIPGRGGNIDAVTVGPPGVFVVETKHRGRGVEITNGRFEVGGREQAQTIAQVTELAMLVQVSVADLMNRHRLTVTPILAIGNRRVTGGHRAGGVLTVDERTIGKLLGNLTGVLTDAEVQELAGAIDRALPPYQRR
jgi:hypothetical protein